MANRALIAKADRATAQRRELGHAEYSKPAYLTSKPEVPAYDLSKVRTFAVGMTGERNLKQHIGDNPKTAKRMFERAASSAKKSLPKSVKREVHEFDVGYSLADQIKRRRNRNMYDLLFNDVNATGR